MGEQQRRQRSSTAVSLKVVAAVGIVLIFAVLALPAWASLRYRSAVHSLHDELAGLELETGEVLSQSATVACLPF